MNRYLLYGFMNLHAVFPAFVYPVFIDDKDGSYYLEDGKDVIIHEFHKIAQDDLIGLYRCSIGAVDQNRQYMVGDKTVYAFMESPNKIIYGDSIRVAAFLTKYKEQTLDLLLIQEIEDFLRDINLKSATESMRIKGSEPSMQHLDSLAIYEAVNFDGACIPISRVYSDSLAHVLLFDDNEMNSTPEERLYVPIKKSYSKMRCRSSRVSSRMFVLNMDSSDFRLMRQYRLLRKQHKYLVLEFQKTSSIYASIIMNETTSNEEDDCFGQDEFIMRMIQKKTWIFPKDQLNAFCNRYDESFPELINWRAHYTASDEEIRNAINQLMIEIKILRTLISYLQDVLEDRGISKTINLQIY